MASSSTGVDTRNGVAHLPEGPPAAPRSTGRPEWVMRGARAGLAASAVLLAGMFVARQTLGVPHLAELASDWALLLVPRGAFDVLLEALGPTAKILLFLTTLAGLWIFGALPGLWHARRGWGLLGGVWLGVLVWLVIGLVLIPLYRGGAFGQWLPAGAGRVAGSTFVLCLAYGLVLGALGPRLIARRAPRERRPDAVRRRLLLSGVVAAAGLAFAGYLVRRGSGTAAGGERSLPRDENGVMQEANRSAGILSPLVTANADFYVVSKNALGDPDLPPEVWGLHVDGLVAAPLDLTYEDLRAFPVAEQYQTLECISNVVGGGLMSNALWRGARVRDVLERAGAQAWAVKLVVLGEDRYSTGIPYAVAQDPDTLLAYEMNGEPLPREHGGPVRMLVPGRYGMKNAKWVMGLRPSQEDYLGFWELNGWTDAAIVKTTTRIDTPGLGSHVGPGPVRIAGVAYAGSRGIQSVQFSSDGGATWNAARLVEQALGPYTWVRWEGEFIPTNAARAVLVARSVDGTGAPQREVEVPPLPGGGSGLHRVTVLTA